MASQDFWLNIKTSQNGGFFPLVGGFFPLVKCCFPPRCWTLLSPKSGFFRDFGGVKLIYHFCRTADFQAWHSKPPPDIPYGKGKPEGTPDQFGIHSPIYVLSGNPSGSERITREVRPESDAVSSLDISPGEESLLLGFADAARALAVGGGGGSWPHRATVQRSVLLQGCYGWL